MKRFVESDDRRQTTLFPEALDDYIADDNPVRAVDLFVDHLDLGTLGFKVVPAAKGRPAHHPSVLLKLYLTATSTASSPTAAWNGRRCAMSSSCG